MNFSSVEVSNNTIAGMTTMDMYMFSIWFLLGLPTNAYVLWLIVVTSGAASEIFLFNLSICEILTSLDSLFFVLTTVSPRVLALVALFLQGVMISSRPLFQCLMCVERFLAVVHPVTFLKLKPLRYRIFCCSVAWIYLLAMCVCCLTIIVFYGPTAHALLYSIQFFLFFTIQSFCLVSVLRALRQSGPGERKEEDQRKRRAFHIILIATVSMICGYVPIMVSGIFTFRTSQYIQALWAPGLVCFVLAGFVQPVIYLQRTGKLSCSSSTAGEKART